MIRCVIHIYIAIGSSSNVLKHVFHSLSVQYNLGIPNPNKFKLISIMAVLLHSILDGHICCTYSNKAILVSLAEFFSFLS